MTTSKYGEDFFVLNNNFASVADGVVVGTSTDIITIPLRCNIVGVLACSIDITTVGGTGVDPLVDLYNESDATILSAPISLDVDATIYTGVVATPSTVYKRGAKLTVRFVTGATTGAIVRPQVVLLCRRLPAA